MIAETKLRSLPCTTNWLAYGQTALNWPSMICGAMYLPPDVLNRSFLRSVIRTNPSSSISPMSPVWNHPSCSASSVACVMLW